MRSLRSRLSYANVISTLCLFMLLGGGAYAAGGGLAKNSVGAKQIKNGAVTGKKIKNGAIDASKLTAETVAALAGTPGPEGKQGPAGEKGAGEVQNASSAYATVFSPETKFTGAHSGFLGVNRPPSHDTGVYCLTPNAETSIDHVVATLDAFNSSPDGASVETFTNGEVLFCEEGQLEVWTHELQRELEPDESQKPESPYVNFVLTNDLSFTVFAPGP